MIVVLFPNGLTAVANAFVSDLEKAFSGHIEIALAFADVKAVWSKEASWDDLLVVLFNENPFPAAGNEFIQDYRTKRNGKGIVLPVTVNAAHSHPPNPCEDIKAFVLDPMDGGARGRLIKRVGAMVGLRVQQRENFIFVSYRASDGKAIATQLEAFLKRLGYPVFLDEGKELDGETKILPGNPVQNDIDNALAKSSVMLLVDTPDAPHSKWISHEVDTANSILLPILPLCFRADADHKKGPRFTSLRQHQRWVSLSLPNGATPPLTNADLDAVLNEMESFLCDLIQRKCRIPFLVGKEFLARKFTWDIVEKKLIVGRSVKPGTKFQTRVLSHCSIFDNLHAPGIKAFVEYMKNNGHPNFSLYIYEGEIIPDSEAQSFIATHAANEPIFILHHQELAALIDSNFAMK